MKTKKNLLLNILKKNENTKLFSLMLIVKYMEYRVLHEASNPNWNGGNIYGMEGATRVINEHIKLVFMAMAT